MEDVWKFLLLISSFLFKHTGRSLLMHPTLCDDVVPDIRMIDSVTNVMQSAYRRNDATIVKEKQNKAGFQGRFFPVRCRRWIWLDCSFSPPWLLPHGALPTESCSIQYHMHHRLLTLKLLLLSFTFGDIWKVSRLRAEGQNERNVTLLRTKQTPLFSSLSYN